MLFFKFKRLKDQKYYKNWTIETVFINILGFIFYGVSREIASLHNKYKLIYTINILFNFVFDTFFEQDHLLNFFILGVYGKRWPNVHVFQYKSWCIPKSDRWCFL